MNRIEYIPYIKKDVTRIQAKAILEETKTDTVAVKKCPPTKRKGKSYSSRWARMVVNDYRL